MTYSKPEVKTLGQATEVIERTGLKPISPVFEPVSTKPQLNPAYDLDE